MPPQQRNREEAVNTQLAIFISRLGVEANAETIERGGTHRPDVLFLLGGLRVAIEGKFADASSAEAAVLADARNRVRAGIAHLAVAAVYPIEFRHAATADILSVFERAPLLYRIEGESGISSEWYEGTAHEILEALRRARDALAQDDVVQRTADSLSARLQGIANLWEGQTGTLERLSALLRMPGNDGETERQSADRRQSAAKISALVLANALIFQEQLSASDERVRTLRGVSHEQDIVSALASHWRWIWQNINYVPIFRLGERVLTELPAGSSASTALRTLLSEAVGICGDQTALRHDLMGRIYHFLLHDAKYLGTYYTSVPAATLLLSLTMSLDWGIDFADLQVLADFKIADLACGTGTLLMAAAQAVLDKYILEKSRRGEDIGQRGLATLHGALMQNILHGYDILPTAVHLTASTLALLAPEVAFRRMNLYVMPVGMDRSIPRLGSIDFFAGHRLNTQFTLDRSGMDAMRAGAGDTGYDNAQVPRADLFVMNPPFVSSRYGNLLFGSHPQDRFRLQRELSRWAKMYRVKATAGLGALFVPLADLYVKPGGRLAFVLPLALATGEAWEPIRRLIADRYELEFAVASHDPARFNFSENTNLSEILFVARRLHPGERRGPTTYVSLWRNPTSVYDALNTFRSIASLRTEARENAPSSMIALSNNRPVADVTVRAGPRGGDNWTPVIFAQSALCDVFEGIDRFDELNVPGAAARQALPVTPLGSLGDLGFDARDVADAFDVRRDRAVFSPYDGFYDHDADRVLGLKQAPNAYVYPRTEPLPGRPLRSAERIWSRASNVLIPSRLRLNTQRLMSIYLDVPVIGNTWWTFHSALSEDQKKSLVLWLNSTFGTLCYFGRRAITEGAWVQMKKPAWSATKVLDVTRLRRDQLRNLSESFDRLQDDTLLPFARLEEDGVRGAIDTALCATLALPSIRSVRTLLAREPSFSNHSLLTV